VQCDVCELWFHLVCVGLNKMDVSDDIDYICRTCRVPTIADARHYTTSIPVSISGENYDTVNFTPQTSDVFKTGQNSRQQYNDTGVHELVEAHTLNNDTVFCETVMQTTGAGYNYLTAEGRVYETQVIEYHQSDVNATADVGDHVDMECHETLDAAHSSSDHALGLIAISDNQAVYPANQVVYMYADGAGSEIESMEDMVEIETVGSAVDLPLDQSCGLVEMDHVEEDSEMCHELVVMESSQVGVLSEGNSEHVNSGHDVVSVQLSPVEYEFHHGDNDCMSVVTKTNEGASEVVQYAPYIHFDAACTSISSSNVVERVVNSAAAVPSGLSNMTVISNATMLNHPLEHSSKECSN